jgi:hypothetical protein
LSYFAIAYQIMAICALLSQVTADKYAKREAAQKTGTRLPGAMDRTHKERHTVATMNSTDQ